jgi:hypothetical protein
MAKFNSSIQRASLAATSSGATAVVAAQGAGKYIKVIRVMVLSKTALDIKFQSAANDITGLVGLAAGGGWRDGMVRNPGDEEDCLFRTNANEALNINLSGAGTVGGYVGYFVSTSP